ncbi:MAG TPA: glycoside hydrolase family 2 TIM barrel-domain containing protein [Gaiellaceae bacterium]|nr:glycoside hydrolase family 2 TIM barrel-domain containing protein [Gaiellaceae bacterium]
MRIELDGVWDFFPGEHALADLDALDPEPIRVPGLWEAQGHLDLDGTAWYRRRFELLDASGYWTLRFGAVMDFADVWVNGVHVGSHECGFTPFELDVTEAVVAAANVVAVRVRDPAVGDPEHGRTAHGKQGWANHAYPSRPSLYMTYGGIWQSVTLLRHGPVVVRDAFANGDPDDLVVSVDAVSRSRAPEEATVRITTLGRELEERVTLAPGERRTLTFRLGAVAAARWSPDDPVLHELAAEAVGSDRVVVRYGLRTIRVEGNRLLLNGEPYRMKSALVQGFRADGLYAEGTREQIVEEVAAARAIGFDTLRLHIKAFHPTYLEVCDELGMLLHCDLPVAEPVDYAELDAGTTLARRCVTAIEEQVRRDRNHPSIVLWSAMNEIGDRTQEARRTPGYERFARLMYATVRREDPTRPVIENDWIEPDPEHVFESPFLTAHVYGRLHRDWLDKLERRLRAWASLDRPFLLSEFGDWGLPDMPELPEPPFWDTRELWAAALARALWPGSLETFVEGTQRYQGLSDRLQTELFRRHDFVGGYCLTELTDVPHELNGLLDLHRNPKRAAVAEMARANRPVLPMLDLRTLAVRAGGTLTAALHVANDGPEIADAEVEVGDVRVRAGRIPAHRATALGDVNLAVPPERGRTPLQLRVLSGGRVVAENEYPLWSVRPGFGDAEVRVVGGTRTTAALGAVGARSGGRGTLVVGEGELSPALRPQLDEVIAGGGAVVVLEQPPEAGPSYPVPLNLWSVETRWGTGFLFAVEQALTALPYGCVLAGEDATVHARSIAIRVDGAPFPERPLLVRYNPRGTTGTIVGAHRIGPGLLVFCQYGLEAKVLAGDVLAEALLADLVRLADEHAAAAAGRRALRATGTR